jgi:hypothetical protein
VAQDDKEQDRALLAYLRGCESANATGEVDAAAIHPYPAMKSTSFYAPWATTASNARRCADVGHSGRAKIATVRPH